MSEEPREVPPSPALPPVTRRNLLFRLGLGLNALAAALVAAGRFDTSFEEAVAACPAPRQSVAGANDR